MIVATAAPLYAHMEDKNQHRIQNHIDNGADHHRQHGIFGAAVRPNHEIDRRGDHHEGKPDADDEAMLQGIGA